MGATKGVLEEEQDFFVRELDKLDWGEVEAQGFGMEGENVDGGWARDEGPAQLEGWWDEIVLLRNRHIDVYSILGAGVDEIYVNRYPFWF